MGFGFDAPFASGTSLIDLWIRLVPMDRPPAYQLRLLINSASFVLDNPFLPQK
jgi:hypothetical protein